MNDYHEAWMAGFNAADFRWNAAFIIAFLSGATFGISIATFIVGIL